MGAMLSGWMITSGYTRMPDISVPGWLLAALAAVDSQHITWQSSG